MRGSVFACHDAAWWGLPQESKDLPAVREMLAVAQRVLGYDMLQVRPCP